MDDRGIYLVGLCFAALSGAIVSFPIGVAVGAWFW